MHLARRLALLAALAPALGGCVRSLHPDGRPTVAPLAAADATTEPTRVDAPSGPLIAAPRAGEMVRAPARVTGSLGDHAGRLAVVQILSTEPDGRELRRGNAVINPVDAAGAFEAVVTYTLAVAGPGVVEVALVEPESGTITERARVAVVLEAAPTPLPNLP